MMSRLGGVWSSYRSLTLAVSVLIALVVALVLVWPITDLIATHDVGLIVGPQRAVRLQVAREAVRTQLLTLGAGLFAAAALVYTARNFTLSRRTVELSLRTVEITEQGQVTDRYTKAIEQIGSEKADVRIGGIYALERIARDSARDHPTVMEVLSAFIREHGPEQVVNPAVHGGKEMKTGIDVEAALTVIGRRDLTYDVGVINLAHAVLQHVHFEGLNLTNVNLLGVDFSHAFLSESNFSGIKLFRAKMRGAFLIRANLSGADLRAVDLSRAYLNGANLTNADLYGTMFEDAQFRNTKLVGADFISSRPPAFETMPIARSGTDFAGADLTDARWIPSVAPPPGWKVEESGLLSRASEQF